MLDIATLFEKQFDKIKERNWEHIYVVVDMHETVFYPTYGNNKELEPYEFAIKTLQRLTKLPTVKLIYWSSSIEEERQRHVEFLKERNVIFDFFNENPQEKSNIYANFEQKFYMNVILDDKAGFDPHEDWLSLFTYLTFEHVWDDNEDS